MENGKKEFNNSITELENLTSSFKQYYDPENYEEIANNARSIKQRIDEANEQAKMINNRETLVAYEDTTDYQSIPAM
jgi:ABC-type Zn uptake system ZnuABC Zn-binding protein ZnuA